MENGNPQVKQYTNYSTKSNNEDGVAYFIQKHILKSKIILNIWIFSQNYLSKNEFY